MVVSQEVSALFSKACRDAGTQSSDLSILSVLDAQVILHQVVNTKWDGNQSWICCHQNESSDEIIYSYGSYLKVQR